MFSISLAYSLMSDRERLNHLESASLLALAIEPAQLFAFTTYFLIVWQGSFPSRPSVKLMISFEEQHIHASMMAPLFDNNGRDLFNIARVSCFIVYFFISFVFLEWLCKMEFADWYAIELILSTCIS